MGLRCWTFLAALFATAAAYAAVPITYFPQCTLTISSLGDPEGAMVVARVGLVGKERAAFHAEMDAKYGAGNWELRHSYNGKLLTREEAWQRYEDSYYEYFKSNPDVLNDLVRRASDVYDTNLSNLASGTDYTIQETASVHLQDIAVRRAVKRLGRRFEGTEPLQMRGPTTPLFHLTPGFIPFVDGSAILTHPRQYQADWITPLSIEDFWQNNRFLVVRAPQPSVRQSPPFSDKP